MFVLYKGQMNECPETTLNCELLFIINIISILYLYIYLFLEGMGMFCVNVLFCTFFWFSREHIGACINRGTSRVKTKLLSLPA